MHEIAFIQACFKVGQYETGSICILNLYRNITHNCLIKRCLAHKNCREPGQIRRFHEVPVPANNDNCDL
jgi:hypothetical protein